MLFGTSTLTSTVGGSVRGIPCGNLARSEVQIVNTGKVKFILREFPLDTLSVAAFMLARCAGSEKRSSVVDLLFDRQKDWTVGDNLKEKLAATLKDGGYSQVDFEKCLTDQKLYEKVVEVRDQASKKFNVSSTPTFFINGQRMSGEKSIEEFDKILAPFLK
jgi:protein-disulfide isomerase